MRDTGQLTATVTQSGATVTISATARWPWGDQAVWSNVVGTIDTVGTFTGPAAEDHTDLDCGRVRYVSRRMTFTLNTMRYTMQADTASCGRFAYSARLTR